MSSPQKVATQTQTDVLKPYWVVVIRLGGTSEEEEAGLSKDGRRTCASSTSKAGMLCTCGTSGQHFWTCSGATSCSCSRPRCGDLVPVGVLWYLMALVHGDCLSSTPRRTTALCDAVQTLTGAFSSPWRPRPPLVMVSVASLRSVRSHPPPNRQLVITMLGDLHHMVPSWPRCSAKEARWTVKFSQHAVVSTHEGRPCLMIRVANMRKSLLLGCQVSGKLLPTSLTKEGETVRLDQRNVPFQVDTSRTAPSSSCPHLLPPHR
ncbi:hypothetical protein FQN60_016651 [Etheostoma spectabile]|uniref:Inward rectifier potassium channel C-terminal domain-containing protein n=1 Tax=Etheostoma spectabile TaxID=54343 RepID=A0A5J5D2P8_9PERO|nr:hypothetical protein FQN60_016651 [Etheostoma spectabile]